MSQRKKTPRNKTPKKRMKNDPLYQAVENMIPKPPAKQHRGGGYNFLQEIENMLNGTCGNSNGNDAANGFGRTYKNMGNIGNIGNNSTTNAQINTQINTQTNAQTTNQYNSNSTPGVVKTIGTNYNPKTGVIGNQYITEHDLNTGKVTSTIICPKPQIDTRTNNGGRGKKYITNQRLSENPFSEIL
jgi:hypothetical protein